MPVRIAQVEIVYKNTSRTSFFVLRMNCIPEIINRIYILFSCKIDFDRSFPAVAVIEKTHRLDVHHLCAGVKQEKNGEKKKIFHANKNDRELKPVVHCDFF